MTAVHSNCHDAIWIQRDLMAEAQFYTSKLHSVSCQDSHTPHVSLLLGLKFSYLRVCWKQDQAFAKLALLLAMTHQVALHMHVEAEMKDADQLELCMCAANFQCITCG